MANDTPTPPPSDLVKLGEAWATRTTAILTGEATGTAHAEWAAFLAGVQRVEGERDALREENANLVRRVNADQRFVDAFMKQSEQITTLRAQVEALTTQLNEANTNLQKLANDYNGAATEQRT